MRFFKTIFLTAAQEFVDGLDYKTHQKVLYNIDLSEQMNDAELFKKLEGEIWEFRTLYFGLQIRLLAFWDKEDKEQTLVLASHGFVKKRSKVPKSEIKNAETIRVRYFEDKALSKK